jgi:hypothetical protein
LILLFLSKGENTFVGRILNAPERIQALKDKEQEKNDKEERRNEKEKAISDVKGMLISLGAIPKESRLTNKELISFLMSKGVMKTPQKKDQLLDLCRKVTVRFVLNHFIFCFPSFIFHVDQSSLFLLPLSFIIPEYTTPIPEPFSSTKAAKNSCSPISCPALSIFTISCPRSSIGID